MYKLLLSTSIIFLCSCAEKQYYISENRERIDFSKYFYVGIQNREYEGKTRSFFSQEMKEIKGDSTSAFIAKYNMRFGYLLQKNISKIIKVYPWDTISVRNRFDSFINGSPFRNYFTLLSNAPRRNNPADSILTFTKKEFKQIASRFIYVEGNKNKGTLFTYICVGNNGVDQLKAARDYTVLEAFAIEAIFDRMNKERNPAFMKDLNQYLIKQKPSKDSSFNFNSFVEKTRQDCFLLMENNEHLEKVIWEYYKKRKSTISFLIME